MDFSHDLISDVAITLEIILNKQAYNLFEDQRFKTERYAVNSIQCRDNQLFNLLPKEIKDSGSLDKSKVKIKKWCYQECSYTSWKTYISNIRYLYA